LGLDGARPRSFRHSLSHRMKHRVLPKAPNALLAGVFQRYDLFRGRREAA
jgi:hypothetical protein